MSVGSRAAGCAAILAAASAIAGCAGREEDGEATGEKRPARVAPLAVPPPSTWPPYPDFPTPSCWGRATDSPRPMRFAPSVAPPPRSRPLPPAAVVERVLRGVGGASAVRRVELGPPPPVTRRHAGYFGRSRPPADALWAYIAAPSGFDAVPAGATPRQIVRRMRAQWELELVGGALRDALCEAGGRPLAGASWGRGGVAFVSDLTGAMAQRFPNPPPAVYRRHVQAVARAYGVRVVSVELLRPLQLAPAVVLEAADRESFARRAARVAALLDPLRPGRRHGAAAFEAFFLEARDARGEPFLALSRTRRGSVSGGQWAWDRCRLPYQRSRLIGAPPCRDEGA